MGKPEIRDYILRYRDRYTIPTLRDQLIRAGYSPAEVDEVGEAIAAGTPSDERPPLRTLLSAYVVGLAVLTFALFAFGTDLATGVGAVALLILAAVLVVVALLSLWFVRANRTVVMGLTAGVLSGLLIPFVAVVIVAGLCVTTTQPTFFPQR